MSDADDLLNRLHAVEQFQVFLFLLFGDLQRIDGKVLFLAQRFQDVAELPRLIGPQMSPDGKTLAYFVTNADWKTNRLVYHMWRQSIGGAAPQQLTFTEAGDIPIARWSPDGTTILFMREGQMWLMSAGGGEPRALSKHATGISLGPNQTPMWSPDGSTIYFLASDPRTAEERERDRVRDDVFAFDETYKQRQLWKIVVSTGAETQITSGDSSLLEFRLSADGKKIVFHRAPTPLDGDANRGEVWVMDASGKNARALTSNAIYEREVDISPDNSQVSFLADTNEKFEPYYTTNLFVVPATGGTPRPAVTDFRYTFDGATWAADSRSLIATVNMGVHSEFYQIDVAARRARQLTDGEHYIPPTWTLARSMGTLVFQLDEPSRFGDVYTLPLGKGSATPARITSLFDRLEREIALPRQERVEWKGADGTTVEGVLFYPVGYEAGKRYPLVVQMHGGPMESDKFGAGPGFLLTYVPVLAAKGYAVLRPNYRGSAGYGNAFFRDVNNGYFHNMATDILTGVDHLAQTGVADPDKVGEQAHHDDRSVQGRLVGRGRGQLGVALGPDRQHGVPAHVVSRHAVAEERADRRFLDELTAQGRGERQDADAVFRRRRRHSRAAGAIDRDVPRTEKPERADAPHGRAA